MRRQVGNIVSVIFSFFKLNMMKLFHGNRVQFCAIERISPNVVIDIDRRSTLVLGSKVRVHSGGRITGAQGAYVRIGNNCRINNNCRIASRDTIILEEGVELGPGVLVYDHDHDFRAAGGIKARAYRTAPVYIGKNVWIGAYSVVLSGTKLGDNCVIGAGSIIKGEFPENSIIIQKRITEVRDM